MTGKSMSPPAVFVLWSPVVQWLVNLTIVSVCFVLPYYVAAQRALAFWTRALQ
jgi:hypothetical protein